MEERSSVHSHEGNERTEVQELSTTLIAQCEGADQSQHTHEQNVVPGNAVLAFHNAEKGLGDGIVAAHSVKQPRRRELRTHSRADVGHK